MTFLVIVLKSETVAVPSPFPPFPPFYVIVSPVFLSFIRIRVSPLHGVTRGGPPLSLHAPGDVTAQSGAEFEAKNLLPGSSNFKPQSG